VTHVHVAVVDDGTLAVTTATKQFTIDVEVARLSEPSARAALWEALAEVVDHPAAWAEPVEVRRMHPGVACALPGQAAAPADTVVWWHGGAWYAARGDDAPAAAQLLRTGPTPAAVADSWTRPAYDIGLTRRADPRIARIAAAAADLAPDWLLRCVGDDLSRHRLHPWPDIDPVTGVCRRVSVRPAEPGFPAAFRHLHAVLPRTERAWPAWQADRLAPAAELLDVTATPGALLDAATASAVAHLAGPWTEANEVRWASGAELAADGTPHLRPEALAVTDPLVVQHPESPIKPLTDDLGQWWLPAVRVRSAEMVWVPFAFCHTYADPSALPGQPVLGYHNLAGLAAARSRDAAVAAGLAHVVAHDAIARWWRRGGAPAPPRLDTPPTLARAWAGATVGLELRLLPSRFAVPVVLAVVRDDEHGLLAMGHAAGPLPRAGGRAAAEALAQLTAMRDLLEPDGLIRRSGDLGSGTAPGLLAHRPERDYLAVAPGRAVGSAIPPRPALRDAMTHLQVGLDPRIRTALEARLADPPPPPAAQPGAADGPGDLIERVVRSGADPYLVDVTPPALRGGGWTAVRVLVPGCLRLEPAAFPLPVEAGVRPEPLPYPGW
jgi:hypothetical protein